ncbi:MAG: hypothetical protein K2P35_08875, partial [Lachnospiraceae bacterium]|nr:hypothetical protein [Lachnospiraceae bacterium]
QQKKKISKILVVISTSIFISYMVIAVIAYAHGADLESLQRFGILRTIQAIQKSPVMDRNVNYDQQGNILVYYRFGCEDCEAVYDSLKAKIAGKEDIYWVASRQSEGQKLLQTYAVSEVPSGVIIQEDGMYTSYMLCDFIYDKTDELGERQLDTDALDRLLELQKREVTK